MSSLQFTERSILEKIFGMGAGYVSDFSDRTFREFVLEKTGIDISTESYEESGTSKANRLRTFWKKESDEITAALTEALLEYSLREKTDYDRELHTRDENLFIEARKIVQRLRDESNGGDVAGNTPPLSMGFTLRTKSPSKKDTNIINASSAGAIANLSDEELLAIIRRAENTNVPGSLYQRANTEWQIRHQQATLKAMKENGKSSFVRIASGAKVTGLTMKGNMMVGDGDFLNNEGKLEDASIENNQHILSATNSKNNPKKWYEGPVGLVVLGVLIAVIAAGITFTLGWN